MRVSFRVPLRCTPTEVVFPSNVDANGADGFAALFRTDVLNLLTSWDCFLLSAVKVNRANAKGETALMHGAASGSVKIVRMLMQVRR